MAFTKKAKVVVEPKKTSESIVETLKQIKTKFGERLRSRTEVAQFNELLCKVLCHNICVTIQAHYELGIEPTFWDEGEDKKAA